ncbi:MAG: hypothetical protein GWN30_18445 [Gammaproteobacteria bacterium]|nr:hypothetical protein [Gammaproteobacteria bacterium]
MKLTFLGTAAANAYPEAFCSCLNCQNARQKGGKNLRKRSAALINDDLLIDLGPDIMAASQMHHIDLTGVQFCLQTHAHADHLDLSHLLSRSPTYGVVGAPRLHFYATVTALERADLTFRRDLADFSLFDSGAQEKLNLLIHAVTPLEPFEVGPYRVIAFPANHDPNAGSVLYAIQSGDRTLFYGTDTAAIFEETWQAFHDFGLSFDLVVLDHTYGSAEPASDHLNAASVIDHMQRMRAEGILKRDRLVFATHIAHEGNPPHDELEEYAHRYGYEIAFDGLSVSI